MELQLKLNKYMEMYAKERNNMEISRKCFENHISIVIKEITEKKNIQMQNKTGDNLKIFVKRTSKDRTLRSSTVL